MPQTFFASKMTAMPRFSANLSYLFTELDFLDRFAAAAKAGFTAVEWHFPYGNDRRDLASRLIDNGLTCVLFNLPAGDWDNGERGITCFADRVSEFKDDVGRAIAFAQALNCKRINCLAGVAPVGMDDDDLRATFVSNLRFATAKTTEAGISLLIEPINTRDVPGFYLNRSSQALSIINAVGSDNLFLQYDVYHMQMMAEHPATEIEANLSRIAHIQIGDVPGRHEPGTGAIDYPGLFDLLDNLGYDGWIGCEYHPETTTTDGLDWIKPYLTRS